MYEGTKHKESDFPVRIVNQTYKTSSIHYKSLMDTDVYTYSTYYIPVLTGVLECTYIVFLLSNREVTLFSVPIFCFNNYNPLVGHKRKTFARNRR